MNPPSTQEYMIAAVANRNYNSSMYIAVFFPVFPILYFGLFFGVISVETNHLGVAFFNFFAKVIFTIYLMEGHTEVLDPVMFGLVAENKSNMVR